MERIERCPNSFSLDISIYQAFGKGTQITISTINLLYLGKAIDDAVRLCLHCRRACLRIERGIGRKEMPCDMATKVAVERFPTTEFLRKLCKRRSTGIDIIQAESRFMFSWKREAKRCTWLIENGWHLIDGTCEVCILSSRFVACLACRDMEAQTHKTR